MCSIKAESGSTYVRHTIGKEEQITSLIFSAKAALMSADIARNL